MVSDPGPDGGKSSVAAAGAVPGASVLHRWLPEIDKASG